MTTGIYYYPESRWYGKTKHGKFMSVENAKAAGFSPAEKWGVIAWPGRRIRARH
jgi:hypothetical protein